MFPKWRYLMKKKCSEEVFKNFMSFLFLVRFPNPLLGDGLGNQCPEKVSMNLLWFCMFQLFADMGVWYRFGIWLVWWFYWRTSSRSWPTCAARMDAPPRLENRLPHAAHSEGKWGGFNLRLGTSELWTLAPRQGWNSSLIVELPSPALPRGKALSRGEKLKHISRNCHLQKNCH